MHTPETTIISGDWPAAWLRLMSIRLVKLCLAAIFCIFGSYLSCLPALGEERWIETVILAKAASREHRFQDAEREFMSALEQAEVLGDKDPRLTASLRLLGKFYLQKSDFDKAVPLFEREQSIMSRLGPTFPGLIEGMTDLGTAYAGQHEYGKAEAALRRALELAATSDRFQNDDFRLRILRGLWSCYQERDWAQALPIAEQLLKYLQTSPRAPSRQNMHMAFNCLAQAYLGNKRYGEAKSAINRAIQLMRHCQDTLLMKDLFLCGSINMRLGCKDEALANFREMLVLQTQLGIEPRLRRRALEQIADIEAESAQQGATTSTCK